MQENEFEKRVRQEMEELRLQPSEAVWEKVEEQLKKKKRRRIIVFIFLLAGLSLLGYSGYFLFNNSKQNIVQQNTTSKTDNSLVKNNQSKPETKKESTPPEQQIIQEDKITGKKEITPVETESKTVKENKIISPRNIVKKKTPTKKERSNRLTIIESGNEKDNIAENKKNTPSEKVYQEKENPASKNKEEISQLLIPEKKEEDKKQLLAKTEPIIVNADSAAIANTIKETESPVVNPQRKKTSRIKWGIDLSAGISSNREKVFSFTALENVADASYSASPGNTTGGVVNNPAFSPSSVKPGPAFKIGMIIEIKLTDRSRITSGLNYTYLSNSIKTGHYKDTIFLLNSSMNRPIAINSFYRGAQQEKYTNRYHLIQLPLNYQFQLNKGIKIPVLWNAGVSAGYLIATNGLVYDATAGGIYYHNKDAFNKFQFSVNTGFALRFGKQGKTQWSLGPELSMSMSKLMKDASYKKQYLLYGGITGRVLFKKGVK